MLSEIQGRWWNATIEKEESSGNKYRVKVEVAAGEFRYAVKPASDIKKA